MEEKRMRNPLIDNERMIFWNKLIEKSKKKVQLNFGAPSKPHAIYASAGKTGLKWSYTVKNNESWVELEIMYPGDKEISHQVFDTLDGHRIDIEKSFGEPIHWYKKPELKSCRIQTKPREKHGMKDPDAWDNLQDILIDKMGKMVKVFTPYISRLN